MQLAEKIKKLGNLFRNRLDSHLLDDAIEYADFSECKLAIEILSDYLVEYRVPISLAEFKEFKVVADEANADSSWAESLRPLVGLVD